MDSMKTVFGCDSVYIINGEAINFLARVLYILYGSPKTFCQKVNDFEQPEVNAIRNECFAPVGNNVDGNGDVGVDGAVGERVPGGEDDVGGEGDGGVEGVGVGEDGIGAEAKVVGGAEGGGGGDDGDRDGADD